MYLSSAEKLRMFKSFTFTMVTALMALSSNQTLLCVPKTNTIFYWGRSFAVAGPKLWNNLPKFIRQAPTSATFRSLLKTCLALII